jgi:amidase
VPVVLGAGTRSYAGPVSNDAVGLEFRQHVDAGEALRTGTYAKALTFTLSTTTP